MRCPTCGGTQYVVESSGALRCITEGVAVVVPPGLGGNLGPQPIPIYGRCNNVATQDEWRAVAIAAERAQRRQAELDRTAAEAFRAQQERAANLERRRVELLAELRRRGNPGLQARHVPGEYHLSMAARVFGRVGEDRLVAVEPAWPIGTCTWMEFRSHGEEPFEDLPTGYTPSERFVPMNYGTLGDAVEMLYGRRRIPGPEFEFHRRDGMVRRPTNDDIVPALERALAG